MDPPDALEKVVRLGCGLLFGWFVGLAVALRLLPWHGYYILPVCLVGGVLCAGAALKYGDRFWVGFSRIAKWGAWPAWRRWWRW